MEEFRPERYSLSNIRRERSSCALWKLGIPPEQIPVYLDLLEQIEQIHAEVTVALASVQRLRKIYDVIVRGYPHAIDVVFEDFEKGYQLQEVLATLEDIHAVLAEMADDDVIE